VVDWETEAASGGAGRGWDKAGEGAGGPGAGREGGCSAPSEGAVITLAACMPTAAGVVGGDVVAGGCGGGDAKMASRDSVGGEERGVEVAEGGDVSTGVDAAATGRVWGVAKRLASVAKVESSCGVLFGVGGGRVAGGTAASNQENAHAFSHENCRINATDIAWTQALGNSQEESPQGHRSGEVVWAWSWAWVKLAPKEVQRE